MKVPDGSGPARRRRPRPGTQFVPIAEVARYEAPRATIDPDQSKTWLRRAMPIMSAHRGSSSPRWCLSFVGPRPPGADPEPAERRHHQLDPAPHRRRSTTTCGGSSASALVGGVAGYISRLLPLPDGLRHRVRPPEHHLRAPDQDVVPLLRPGAVGPAHLAGQLGHPLGADVHDLRPDDPGAVLASPWSPSASCCRSTCRWPSWPWPPCRSSTWPA